MPIDQSKLGQHIQEQMEAIESDPNIPDDAEINSILTIVEVISKEKGVRSMRLRKNVPPTVAIGLLEEAKAIQLRELGGG